MAITPRLELRQGQSLVMTPQLQQAIKLLQLSNVELTAFVEQELERNPLLERDEGAGAGPAPSGVDAPDLPVAATGELVATDSYIGIDAAPPAAGGDLDTDFENVYADATAADRAEFGPGAAAMDWGSGRGGSSRFDDGEFDPDGNHTTEENLQDHLQAQLILAVPDPVDRMIGGYLIDLVDEAGYLTAPLEDAAERLGTPVENVERVLKVLQGFDPTGICARNLAECLGLQLKEKDRLDPAMQMLLENLPMLARRELPQLMKLCGVDGDDLADMIKEIRELNPKPGLAFGSTQVQVVVPDVYVRQTPEGSWHMELNSETLPRVLVSNRYYAKVSKSPASKADKAFVSECLQNANWLVKSLDQRARTILKVASEIVRYQDGFLARGVQYLRPLNLKTVAEAINMHESTVSRVTANKYLATPRGVYEFKYFFTSAIQSSDGGDAHSAEAVRHKIKELIDEEEATNVLSDDRLVELLKAAGMDIARRTVAKYREAMRIPSSVERRRQKMMALKAAGAL